MSTRIRYMKDGGRTQVSATRREDMQHRHALLPVSALGWLRKNSVTTVSMVTFICSLTCHWPVAAEEPAYHSAEFFLSSDTEAEIRAF